MTTQPVSSLPANPIGFSPWWRGVPDPVLTGLIDHGLAGGQMLACQVQARQKLHKRAIFGLYARRDGRLKRAALALAVEEARSRQALAIGLAYVEVRRDQNRVTLRQEAVAKLRDNREIAGFRREAGLVSDLDVGLSRMMVDLNANAITSAEAELAGGLDRLAAVTGYSAAQLRESLADQARLAAFADGEAPTVDAALAHRADLLEMRQMLLAERKITEAQIDGEPPTGIAAKASHVRDAYRAAQAKARADLAAAAAALATATTQAEALRHTVAVAEHTLFDARLNYRLGKGGMALLYVSEASALAARESLLQALAALDAAAIQLWTAQGRGWSMADPLPAARMNGAAACD